MINQQIKESYLTQIVRRKGELIMKIARNILVARQSNRCNIKLS